MPVPVCSYWESLLHPSERVAACQEPGGLEYIHQVAKDFNPDVIVELGTQSGGVTIALHEACAEARLDSFDIENNVLFTAEFISVHALWPKTPRALFGRNVTFWSVDVLLEGDNLLRYPFSLPGRKLLYCDNGNKREEVRLWSPYLKPGDLLGVHDWMEEIGPEDIPAGFIPYRHEECQGRYLLSRFWLKEGVR